MSKRILIMPDSFKGSMTAVEATDILAKEAEKAGATVVRLPLADGGELILRSEEASRSTNL